MTVLDLDRNQAFPPFYRYDPIAQLVEPAAHNGIVTGSSPVGITTK